MPYSDIIQLCVNREGAKVTGAGSPMASESQRHRSHGLKASCNVKEITPSAKFINLFRKLFY